MSRDLIIVTKRLAKQMAEISESQVPRDEKGLALFMGLGLALAMCFEQVTGKSAQNRKPQEVLRWALDLPLDNIITVTKH